MISMVKIFEAIIAINPNAKVTVRGNTLDDFVVEFLDGTNEIARQTIINKYNELNGE
jgi:voltage-gated potassium channel Kch